MNNIPEIHEMEQYDLFESVEKQESLDVLNYQIRACERCSLSLTRKHALTGEGDVDARIMFVALSPGAKEDVQNRMFIGPSGQVFNRLLNASGIDRELVFMTNLVKCMLPKNRKPTMNEIEACSQFLNEEILIIQPEVIVPLGAYATNAILTKYHIDKLSAGMSFTNINGKILSNEHVKVFPLPHPAALLYNPSFEPGTIEKYKRLKTYM
jgi:DNA polymerase